ncbi:MAG: DUF1830 domain-containing protein [Leptolyngbyaceae cyanobacterium SM2_5_2]|nr:DUF1830 domain-containing protein [Leptolyngbyaceae cyanobacterium SM2_5_2]
MIIVMLNSSRKIFCRYTNHTPQFQIVRISNIPHWFFERTVIPHGYILFDAFQDAQLELHTSTMMDSILSDTIPCIQLIQTHPRQNQTSQFVKNIAQELLTG